MKSISHFYSFLALIIFSALFIASSSGVQKMSTTEKTYYETKKPPENITVSYQLPVIKPMAKTPQTQTKGSVTISIEIVPFTVDRMVKQDKTIAPADPTQRGYDIFEVANNPSYKVLPEAIQFIMKIRNANSDVPLHLSQIAFGLFVDGTQWDFPKEFSDTWEKGLVSYVAAKEYKIVGPQLSGLYSAQIIFFSLSGVPTSYDGAGMVSKKEKFEWYFECKSEEVQKQEQRTYTYESSPIHKEQCSKCTGTGTDPQPYKCSSCDGKGSRVNIIDGKTYKCDKCSGTGKVYIKCGNCSGGGVMYYPKSNEAPIKSSLTWTGWQVSVKTNPPGAKVSVVDTKTGEYKSAGLSNLTVNWFSSDQKSYPIIVDYQGRKVNVIPYGANGKETAKVEVDFSAGTATVKKGKKVD